MNKKKLKIDAEWTNDCQGKKDYDGNIISISSRYWPSNYQSNGKISAKSSLILRFSEYPEYITLVSKEFNGDTEAEVKHNVEIWAQEQYNKIVGILPKEFPNNKIGINFPMTFQIIAYFIMGICLGVLIGIATVYGR